MKRVMGVWDIVFINVAGIIGLRWLPVAAGYGAASISLWVLAALLFFIPLGLVSTELATTWPDQGGMYVWVREAYGEKAGFMVSWFYWTNSFFYCPGLLTFVAVTLGFIISPDLEKNKLFVCGFALVFLWIITFINLRGMETFLKLANLGGTFGTLLPGLLLILLGFGAVLIWKKPIPTDFSLSHWIPTLGLKSHLAFLSVLMFSMAGIELTPIMAGETENPQKTFPRATLISAILIVSVYIIGTVAMTFSMAPEKIGAASGINDAIALVTKNLHVALLGTIIVAMIMIGNIGGIGVWIVAPVKMLLESCKNGILPTKFTRLNKHGMPGNAVLVQAIVVTIVIIATALLPSVNVFYETLILMATITYFIPYIFMFATFLKLRHAQPDKVRPYNVPGGKPLAWLISLVGIASVTLAIVLPFIVPPEDVQSAKDLLLYRIELAFGPVLFTVLGYVIYKLHEWKNLKIKI